MKYIFFSFMLLSVTVQSQIVKVIRNEQITKQHEGEFIVSCISSDGESLLASTPGYKGLLLIDLKGKKIEKITDKTGAGYQPAFSADGKKIYYRSDEYIDLRKFSSLICYDLLTKKDIVLENRSRDMSPPETTNNKLLYSVGGIHKEKITGTDIKYEKGNEIYVMLENLKPVLYENGSKRIITPSGDGKYIWVSLSPDKSKILYNYEGRATYVSDIKGNIIAGLGRFDAPEWLNDQIIIGMDDKDDGYRIISSDIISYSMITGIRTNLTPTPNRIEMDPKPMQNGNKVFYNTVDGELYVLYLDLNN